MRVMLRPRCCYFVIIRDRSNHNRLLLEAFVVARLQQRRQRLPGRQRPLSPAVAVLALRRPPVVDEQEQPLVAAFVVVDVTVLVVVAAAEAVVDVATLLGGPTQRC